MRAISQFWQSGLTGKLVLGCGTVLGLLGILCVCGTFLIAVIGASRTPTPDVADISQESTLPIPTQRPQAANTPVITGAPKPIPAISPTPSFTFEGIVSNAKQLTEIKRNDYYKSLVGKRAHWSGKVADVSDNGDVKVRITSTFSYDVVIQGVPKANATTLNLKDSVDFEGTITDVSDLFGSGSPIITLKFITLTRQ